MSPSMKASGLARSRAIIICSMLTPRGRSRLAMLQSVSLEATGPYSPLPACTTGRRGALRCGAAREVAAAAGAALTLGARRRVVTGGSSSTVYSRIRRPLGQLTSTRKSRKGSRIGKSELTWMTVLPFLRRVGRNLSRVRKKGRSMPAFLNSSGLASRTRTPSSSPAATESRSMSARNSWLRADLALMSPSPSACAGMDTVPSANATANVTLRTMKVPLERQAIAEFSLLAESWRCHPQSRRALSERAAELTSHLMICG